MTARFACLTLLLLLGRNYADAQYYDRTVGTIKGYLGPVQSPSHTSNSDSRPLVKTYQSPSNPTNSNAKTTSSAPENKPVNNNLSVKSDQPVKSQSNAPYDDGLSYYKKLKEDAEAKGMEQLRLLRIDASFRDTHGDTTELKLMFQTKMYNYVSTSNNKGAIKCYDSLVTYLKENNLSKIDLTNFDRTLPTEMLLKIIEVYKEGYENMPDHKEYLLRINELCKRGLQDPDRKNLNDIYSIQAWCEIERGYYEKGENMLTGTIESFEHSNKYYNDWFYSTNSYYYRAIARYKLGKYMEAAQDINLSLSYHEPIGVVKSNEMLTMIKNPPSKVIAYQTSPLRVFKAGSAGWSNLESGRDFIFGIKKDSTIWATGNNDHAQLGMGNTIETEQMEKLTQSDEIKTIRSGLDYTVAIKKDGSLWHWGWAVDESREGIIIPKKVDITNDWSNIAAGYFHTLLLKNNGTLWAFGRNYDGELGLGYDGTISGWPVQIGKDKNWKEAFGGNGSSYALKKDGSLWAWGLNKYGQLGIGTLENSKTPVEVAKGTGKWKKISCGGEHILALKEDGTLWAWGDNTSGELGTGDTIAHSLPVQVGRDNDWSQISAGSAYSCAIKSDGSLWAWGNNDHGQLGIEILDRKNLPVRVGMDNDWNQINCSKVYNYKSMTFAIKSDGSIWAWGSKVEWLQ